MVGLMLTTCSQLQRQRQAQKQVNDILDSTRKWNIQNESPETKIDRKIDSISKRIDYAGALKSPESTNLEITAYHIKEKSDSLRNYINSLRKTLKDSATGDDDFNISTRLLAEGPDGKFLYKMLMNYQHDLTALMKPYALHADLPLGIYPPSSENGKQTS